MRTVSVIIPHFESATSLELLLDSIPKADFITPIVVDDKSKDLEGYKKIKNDPRFGHVVFLNNTSQAKGAGVCRNIGLQAAQSDWVIFADADDVFTDNLYNALVAFVQFEIDVVFFAPISKKINNEPSNRHVLFFNLISNYLKNPSRENEIKLRYLFHPPWSKLIRRELLQNNSILFEEVISANDVMFSVQVGAHMNKFLVSDQVIYCVIEGTNTLTTKKDKRLFENRLDVFVRSYHYTKQKLSPDDFRILNLNGHKFTLGAYFKGYGLPVIIRAAFVLIKNRIPLGLWPKSPLKALKKLSGIFYFRGRDIQ